MRPATSSCIFPTLLLLLTVEAVPLSAGLAPTAVVLPGASFDSRTGDPAPFSAGRRIDGESGLYLVQTFDVPDAARVRAVESAGAHRIVTIPPANLLVWLDSGNRSRLAGTAEVRWIARYQPVYAVPANLRERTVWDGALSVLLARFGQDDAALRENVGAIAGPPTAVFEESPELLRLIVPLPANDPLRALAVVDAIATLPNTVAIGYVSSHGSIRDEMSDQILADETTGGTPTLGYSSFLTAKGYDGSGITVGVVDEGSQIDHGELVHDSPLCLNYLVGDPAGACTATGSTCGSHGTMTAGIVLGDGISGVTHGGSFLSGLGIAPGARLLAQNFLCSPGSGATPPTGPLGWLRLSRDQVLNGAYISANSWGPSDTPLGYDAFTREFDRMPRDGDPLTTGVAEPIAFVLSIMNGSGGTSTQGTPDEGKNLIRVGGTKNFAAGNIDDLCTCTAHGPALDGRMLPDLVAPGQTVFSTSTGNSHSSGTGTSFASPHISGAAALLASWFEHDPALGYLPSPALLKALMVASCDDLAGAKDADGVTMGHRPDNKQGWGRFNLDRALAPETRSAFWDQSAGRTFTAGGQSLSFGVRADDPALPLRISLVWTDALGPGLGGATPSWVNDLDLSVDGPTTTYLGNVFNNGWSATGGTKDSINNVENVFIATPGADAWTITVDAAVLLGDGVWSGAPSSSADDFDQDFALVCENCIATLIFVDGFDDGLGNRWSLFP
ncbi:MAG: S8 family serine peptidase [Thermoanaerobaculia bacterium]